MRFTHAAANSAAHAETLRYRQLVEIGVTSGTVYACSGAEYLYTLGNTYSPVGAFGAIEAIEEEADGSPRTVRAYLSATGSADLYEALREDMFNRQFVVRHGYLDPSTTAFVSTPELLWSGRINKVEARFADVERGNFIEIEAETMLRKRAPVSNFNLETHWVAMGHSGDLFFQFIDQVPLFRAMWGQQPTAFVGASGAVPNGGNALPDYTNNRNWYIRFGG